MVEQQYPLNAAPASKTEIFEMSDAGWVFMHTPTPGLPMLGKNELSSVQEYL